MAELPEDATANPDSTPTPASTTTPTESDGILTQAAAAAEQLFPGNPPEPAAEDPVLAAFRAQLDSTDDLIRVNATPISVATVSQVAILKMDVLRLAHMSGISADATVARAQIYFDWMQK